jgi:hypothetical protein
LTPTTPLPTAPNMGNQFLARTIPNPFPTDPYVQQSTPTAQLLCYLFSPPALEQAPAPPPINGNGGAARPGYYDFVGSIGQLQPDPLQDWGEFGKDFLSETFRSEYAPASPYYDFRIRLKSHQLRFRPCRSLFPNMCAVWSWFPDTGTVITDTYSLTLLSRSPTPAAPRRRRLPSPSAGLPPKGPPIPAQHANQPHPAPQPALSCGHRVGRQVFRASPPRA